MTKILGRADLLGADLLRRDTVDAKAAGGKIQIRELTGREAAEFQARSMAAVNAGAGTVRSVSALSDLSAYVWICGVIDDNGDQLFTKDDAAALADLPNSVLDPVADAILILSGITEPARRKTEKK